MPALFGAKLRYLRVQHGVAQAELARQLALSRYQINNLESGRRSPSYAVVVQVGDIFAVSCEYLLRDTVPLEAADEHQRVVSGPGAFNPQVFGSKLHHLRTTHTLTQIALAPALGLRTQAHISLLESGGKEPSIDLLLRIADFFGVTADYLLDSTVPLEGT